MIKKIFFIFALFLIIILLTSQASAIFGCAPKSDTQAYVWKEAEAFHLRICFTPRDNVETLLKNNGINYDGGILKGNFNLKYNDAKEEYESYTGDILLRTIISTLRQEFFATKDINEANRIAEMLNTLSLIMIEDGTTQIIYSTSLALDENGIVNNGKINIPRYNEQNENNIMYAGGIITPYTKKIALNQIEIKKPYVQPEFKISGISIEFVKSGERKLTWHSTDSYLKKADRTGKTIINEYTADAGTIVKYITKDKRFVKERGILYKDGEEIKNAYVQLISNQETQICCLTDPDYCVTSEQKKYPLDKLGTAGNFGIGNFEVSHNEETKESLISEQATEIVYTKNPNKILELIS